MKEQDKGGEGIEGGGGGGYGDQEPLELPRPLTDVLTIIRTSPLWALPASGDWELLCSPGSGRTRLPYLVGEDWWIPPPSRGEKGEQGAKRTIDPAGSTIPGESLGRRGQTPTKDPRVPGARMGGGSRVHTLPPMLQSPGACGWCEVFAFIVRMRFF